MKKIKVGIAGLGRLGRVHAQNLAFKIPNAELTAACSEYDYLSTKMGEITSRSSLQEVAEGRLGLVRLDASQITYVRLEEDSVIEKTGDSATRFLAQVRTAALSLLGNLNP